jgi:hypothetical protein
MNKTLLALIVVFITATSIYSQPPTKNSWNNKNRKKPTKKIKEFIPKKGKGYVIVSAFLDKNKKLYSSSSLLYRKQIQKTELEAFKKIVLNLHLVMVKRKINYLWVVKICP